MKNETEKNSNGGGRESINKSRRRLSKTGLAAPVLLSLASKPSWAFVCNFSHAMSGNLSAQLSTGIQCDEDTLSTKSPGYYKNNPWPPSTCLLTAGTEAANDGTGFNAFFGGPAIKLAASGTLGRPNYKPELLNPSILNVLKNNSRVVFVSNNASDNNCAFHYAAAAISACTDNSGGVIVLFPFTIQQVIAGWQSQDSNFCNQIKLIQAGELTVGQVGQIINW